MPKKVIKILSLDGGGVRGIISAMVLTEIERLAKKPIAKLFNVIAGCSIGSLLAVALTTPGKNGRPKYSAEDLVHVFEKEGEKIFDNPLLHKMTSFGGLYDAIYSNVGLQKILKAKFGNATLKKSLTEVVVPALEIEMGGPFLFKSSDAKKNENLNFFIRDIALASSAFPLIFPPYQMKANDPKRKHYAFIDGAIAGANNPSMCAYLEAKTLFPNADEYLLVSVGTGDYGENMLYEVHKHWGATKWLVEPLINSIMIGQSDMTDQQMKSLFATSGDNLNHYYRLQSRIHKEESMVDDAGEINLRILKLLAENLIRDENQKLNEISKKLLEF